MNTKPRHTATPFHESKSVRPLRKNEETMASPGELCEFCDRDAVYVREVRIEYEHAKWGSMQAIAHFPLCHDHIDWEPRDHHYARIIEDDVEEKEEEDKDVLGLQAYAEKYK